MSGIVEVGGERKSEDLPTAPPPQRQHPDPSGKGIEWLTEEFYLRPEDPEIRRLFLNAYTTQESTKLKKLVNRSRSQIGDAVHLGMQLDSLREQQIADFPNTVGKQPDALRKQCPAVSLFSSSWQEELRRMKDETAAPGSIYKALDCATLLQLLDPSAENAECVRTLAATRSIVLSPLLGLPIELWQIVFRFLPVEDLPSAGLANWFFHKVSITDLVWHRDPSFPEEGARKSGLNGLKLIHGILPDITQSFRIKSFSDGCYNPEFYFFDNWVCLVLGIDEDALIQEESSVSFFDLKSGEKIEVDPSADCQDLKNKYLNVDEELIRVYKINKNKFALINHKCKNLSLTIGKLSKEKKIILTEISCDQKITTYFYPKQTSKYLFGTNSDNNIIEFDLEKENSSIIAKNESLGKIAYATSDYTIIEGSDGGLKSICRRTGQVFDLPEIKSDHRIRLTENNRFFYRQDKNKRIFYLDLESKKVHDIGFAQDEIVKNIISLKRDDRLLLQTVDKLILFDTVHEEEVWERQHHFYSGSDIQCLERQNFIGIGYQKNGSRFLDIHDWDTWRIHASYPEVSLINGHIVNIKPESGEDEHGPHLVDFIRV